MSRLKLQVFQLPVLDDNYIYILHEPESQKTAVVDPALADPVNKFLEQKKLKLDFILNTHHHLDHTGGNLALQKKWGCVTAGFAKEAHRIPGLSLPLKEGDIFKLGRAEARILFLPGHTLGHIAFCFLEQKKLFCGDVLFGMGCGRLFEGSHQQMWHSLQQVKNLPPDTWIYCAHEYTEKNSQFAFQERPKNSALKNRCLVVQELRKQGKATVPFLLSEELDTNPFLMAKSLKEFKTLRQKRDLF